MPVTGRGNNTLNRERNSILGNIAEAGGDLGGTRWRIDRGDTDLDGFSYGSIIMDGIATTTERTAGMPVGSAFNRVSFPNPDGVGYTFYLTSTNAGDSVAGGGAEKVFISGLNQLWEPISEEVTMTGQTGAATSNTNWLRINKMFVSQVATNGNNNLGAIYVSITNDAVLGVPQTDVVAGFDIGYGYFVMGIVSAELHQRLYFTRGSYYTDARSLDPLINNQYDVYPWDASTPTAANSNRIKLLVGRLVTNSTVAFNTSGSAPEFPATDIEFTVQAGNTNREFSIFWNTIRVKDVNSF